MSYRTIGIERNGPRTDLALASPPLNILDLELLGELADALDGVERDPDPPHVVVIRGDGEKAFSAGASVADHAPDSVGEMLTRFHHAIRIIPRMPSIVIAAVHGHCLGGGLELAAACDLVVATESAVFAQPEIDLACFPPVASAWFPRLVGEKRAAEIVLLGGRFSAARARDMGLINDVVPEDGLDGAVDRWVETLAAKSRAALAIAKRSLRLGASNAPSDALNACEALYLEELVETEDMNEGIASFMEKRRPRWRHR